MLTKKDLIVNNLYYANIDKGSNEVLFKYKKLSSSDHICEFDKYHFLSSASAVYTNGAWNVDDMTNIRLATREEINKHMKCESHQFDIQNDIKRKESMVGRYIHIIDKTSFCSSLINNGDYLEILEDEGNSYFKVSKYGTFSKSRLEGSYVQLMSEDFKPASQDVIPKDLTGRYLKYIGTSRENPKYGDYFLVENMSNTGLKRLSDGVRGAYWRPGQVQNKDECASFELMPIGFNPESNFTPITSDPLDLKGRYVKALIDKPCGGWVLKNEYGLIKKHKYDNTYTADFPSQESYAVNLGKKCYEIMPEGFDPKHAIKVKFIPGRWYEYTGSHVKPGYYSKYSEKQPVSDRFYYDEAIFGGRYGKIHDWSSLSAQPVLLEDLTVIQKWLPENHPDKMETEFKFEVGVWYRSTKWPEGFFAKFQAIGGFTGCFHASETITNGIEEKRFKSISFDRGTMVRVLLNQLPKTKSEPVPGKWYRARCGSSNTYKVQFLRIGHSPRFFICAPWLTPDGSLTEGEGGFDELFEEIPVPLIKTQPKYSEGEIGKWYEVSIGTHRYHARLDGILDNKAYPNESYYWRSASSASSSDLWTIGTRQTFGPIIREIDPPMDFKVPALESAKKPALPATNFNSYIGKWYTACDWKDGSMCQVTGIVKNDGSGFMVQFNNYYWPGSGFCTHEKGNAWGTKSLLGLSPVAFSRIHEMKLMHCRDESSNAIIYGTADPGIHPVFEPVFKRTMAKPKLPSLNKYDQDPVIVKLPKQQVFKLKVV